MNQNGGFNSYNNGDGRYTHVDNAYNSGTFMNSELKRTESTPLAPSYPDHKSTSPIELQQHQFQDLTSNSFVPQPEVPQLDLYGHSIQQLLDSPQLGLDCIPTSTQALTNSSASTNPFGMEYAHSFIGTQVIAQPAPMLRSHTSHSSIVSIHSTNGFGFDSTPDLFGLYGPLTQGGYPMQPSISNSSERPQDAQAANVLARLAQAPSNDLFDNELCNNDAVCVEECDPGSIYDCATFDINPCYDPACPDRCEVDGVDMTCEKPHSLNIDTSPAVPSDSDRDSWAASTPQEQFSAGFISKEFNSPWQLCFHEEHMHTGCVNPLDVIKRTDLPVITAANCCCNDPEHKPDPENVIRRRRSHESRQKHKIIRRRTISHQKQLSNAASQEHQYSSAEHSRSSSITFGMLSISPISSLSDFQQDQSMFQSTPIIHMCQWLNSGTSLLCGIRFESTATLQAHVENDHILSIRVSKHKKDRLEHCCHWSTCDAAISGKPFRQVQHLKDHIRTHTLFKPFLCDFIIDDVLCNKEFGDKKALESHIRSHTKEKPYKCPECLRYFSHQSSLATHRQQHQQRRRYKCPECNHTDNDRANLGRHYDTHFRNRFSCRFCLKTFSKKANGMRHLKSGSCKAVKEIVGARELNPGEVELGIVEQPRDAQFSRLDVTAD